MCRLAVLGQPDHLRGDVDPENPGRTSLLQPTRVVPFAASQVENGPTGELADEAEKTEALRVIAKGQQFGISIFVGDLIIRPSDLAIGPARHSLAPSNRPTFDPASGGQSQPLAAALAPSRSAVARLAALRTQPCPPFRSPWRSAPQPPQVRRHKILSRIGKPCPSACETPIEPCQPLRKPFWGSYSGRRG